MSLRHVKSRFPTATLFALCLPIWTSAPGAPGASGADDVPFAAFGQAYLKAHGNPAQASDLPLETLRAKWCVHVALGAVDLAYPISFLSDKPRVEDFKAVCKCLLEMQSRWIEWLLDDPAKVKSARADIAALRSWIEDWKPAGFARAAAAEDKDLFKLLTAGDAEVQAAKRLNDLVCASDVLGVGPKEGKPISILLSPTRRDFVELLGYAGLLDAAQQPIVWLPDAPDWTTFWVGWDLVMALEYPPWDPDPQFKTGLSMNKFDKNGLEQHAVLQAANAWQWMCFGDDGAPYFHQAVAMNLAIAVCGEINALEGDGWGYGTTGGRTNPYEKFVPGGNSQGGTLPAIPATSQDGIKKGRWREGFGRDHFAAPLRKGQKNAAKDFMKDRPDHLDAALIQDKSAHFLLVASDGQAKYVVSAPFFGPHSKTKPYPPTPVILDYREFFRAYKCAFVNWLQTQGAGDAAPSTAKFRDLLRKMGAQDGRAIEEVLLEIYGTPLSAKNGEDESLEWRFLEWLVKGK